MAACSCNKSFSSDHMLLSPEDVGLCDLIRILFSNEIEKRKFVDCQKGTEEPFNRRWLIFVSVLSQKFLRSVSKPMAWFGSVAEHWLNLLSSNRNFGVLVLNFLRGTPSLPPRKVMQINVGTEDTCLVKLSFSNDPEISPEKEFSACANCKR
ncbi:unnamed protein product [Ilex paraguariensis]|uniref:Uncharacterized protein n=1 Tax=Ilex paraguariensis TaxID=185542 RepID=A0ABC8UIV0_9AQUA